MDKYKFGNSEAWKKAVLKTYSLEEKELEINGEIVRIFGNGSYYSHTPYITDGGYFDKDFIWTKEVFQKITQPILIKSRNPLNISSEVDYCLVDAYNTYVLDISKGEEDVWKNKIQAKKRTHIRKGEKSNYTIKFGQSELLDDFYEVMSQAWLDLGTPTHSKNFYKNIVENMSSTEEGYYAQFVVIYIEDKPVSAACIINDDYSLHHPYAATLKSYNNTSINNVLYWEIIKYAIKRGCKIFDLGRSKKDQGTATYKLSFGAEEVNLYYYYFNKTKHDNVEDSKITQFLIECWKKLPLGFANFLGPKLIYKVMK